MERELLLQTTTPIPLPVSKPKITLEIRPTPSILYLVSLISNQYYKDPSAIQQLLLTLYQSIQAVIPSKLTKNLLPQHLTSFLIYITVDQQDT